MITISQLTWTTLPQFLAWCLAVYALAHAIFRSMPAEELLAWIWRRSSKTRRLAVLQWELRMGTEWTDRQAEGDAFAARRPLTPAEIEARMREANRLSARTLPLRALTYLLHCPLCQGFWTATAVLLSTASWQSAGDLFMTAFACAGLLAGIQARINQPTGYPEQHVSSRDDQGCAGGAHQKPLARAA